MPGKRALLLILVALGFPVLASATLPTLPDYKPGQVQRKFDPPSLSESAEELEQQGDQYRDQKAYLDAADFFHAAAKKKPTPLLYNKAGICELQLYDLKDAKRDFEHAIKMDKHYAEAINNLGVVFYWAKQYGKAASKYSKAISLQPDNASFHSNLGSAFFDQKNFPAAAREFALAMRLDPDIFERLTRTGMTARLSSPEDRAHFNYIMARLYAQSGSLDRSLQCLKRAMEEGYKDINDVYKDPGFASLRRDKRFEELMKVGVPVLSE
jgi:tetratricopeptide (TPR) repeat protein